MNDYMADLGRFRAHCLRSIRLGDPCGDSQLVLPIMPMWLSTAITHRPFCTTWAKLPANSGHQSD